MTPAARAFIRSQATDIEHALLPMRLLGLPLGEFIVLLLDTGERIGMPSRPLIYLTQRNALAALQRAAGTNDGFDCDAPGVQDFFGCSHDSAAGARAVKILLDEASHLIDQPASRLNPPPAGITRRSGRASRSAVGSSAARVSARG